MSKFKCNICGKPCKENMDGNKRYCQGHSIFEERNNDEKANAGKKSSK